MVQVIVWRRQDGSHPAPAPAFPALVVAHVARAGKEIDVPLPILLGLRYFAYEPMQTPDQGLAELLDSRMGVFVTRSRTAAVMLFSSILRISTLDGQNSGSPRPDKRSR